ncbi:uncharacterized protein LOC141776778 [Sebastes fasciatus]|uniref:uncharacterized protein LOC141776778 n=1 Tax=Sebastes fasciatus TaxID=394691 RepID=UPI003D9E64C3
MQFEMNLAFCVLVLLTGSSQTRGQSSALPLTALPSHAGSSASPDLTDPEVSQRTHSGEEISPETTTVTKTEGTVHTETVTHLLTTSSAVAKPSATADNLSSAPTVQSAVPPQHISTPDGRVILTTDPFTTFSSQPAPTVQQDTSSTAHASTIQPRSESLTTAATQPPTTGHPLTSAPGQGPAGHAHREGPSELNVGDEELNGRRHRSSSPLDPLLAGLLSVFIVTTAVVFVILFLKFRQRTNHPEFHRLQDLPMDDLMEDTPLSRYTY